MLLASLLVRQRPDLTGQRSVMRTDCPDRKPAVVQRTQCLVKREVSLNRAFVKIKTRRLGGSLGFSGQTICKRKVQPVARLRPGFGRRVAQDTDCFGMLARHGKRKTEIVQQADVTRAHIEPCAVVGLCRAMIAHKILRNTNCVVRTRPLFDLERRFEMGYRGLRLIQRNQRLGKPLARARSAAMRDCLPEHLGCLGILANGHKRAAEPAEHDNILRFGRKRATIHFDGVADVTGIGRRIGDPQQRGNLGAFRFSVDRIGWSLAHQGPERVRGATGKGHTKARHDCESLQHSPDPTQTPKRGNKQRRLAVAAYQNVKAACPDGIRPASPARPLRRLWHCIEGITGVEFALAAPVILAMVAGIIEFALVMFVSTLSEGALREASRFSITGFIPPGMTRESRLLQIVGDHTIGLVDMDAASITYKVYPSFNDIGKPEPFTDTAPANGSYDAGEPFQDINGNGQWDSDMGAAGLGGPGDIVLYTIEFDWELMTPLVAPLVGTDGKLRIKSSVAVRNEPFDVPPAAPAAGG